jgi:tripartite-type tricarboxylate transporter receptor subunit TctC
MPLLPHILEKARNQEERQIINMVTIFSEIGRPFVAGSKVPEDRLAILREAFNKTIVDKDFLAEAAKSRRDVISPMTGEVVEKRIAELYATPKPVIGKVANAIK